MMETPNKYKRIQSTASPNSENTLYAKLFTAQAGDKLKLRRICELEDKLQIIIKHNTNLLNEVNQLQQELFNRDKKIAMLEGQMTHQYDSKHLRDRSLEKQRQGLKCQIQRHNTLHMTQIGKLTQELHKWRSEALQIQKVKNLQIAQLKKNLQKQFATNLNKIKQSQAIQNQTSQQAAKVRQALAFKSYEIEQLTLLSQNQMERLTEQLSYLKQIMKHRQDIKQNQLNQIIIKNSTNLQLLSRQHVNEKDLICANYDKQIIKLRNQINSKSLEIAALQHRIRQQGQSGQVFLKKTNSQKEYLMMQLQKAVNLGIQTAQQQRLKERQLHKIQEDSLKLTSKNRQLILSQQINKLKQLLEQRTSQLQRLQNQLLSQRDLFNKDLTVHKQSIAQLKQRLNRILVQDQIQIQSLKAKFAQLSQADVKMLVQQLQRQGQDLVEQLRRRQKQLQEKTEKVQALLKDKHSQRKAFEELVQQLRKQKQDISNKLKLLRQQKQEQAVMMRSKMQVQTGNVLRECQSQKKNNFHLQDEKRNLKQVIEAKDLEISMLNEKLSRVKANFDEERRQLQQRLIQRNNLFQELDMLRNNQIQNLKLELSKQISLAQQEKEVSQKKIDQLKKNIQEKLDRITGLQRQVLLDQKNKQDLSRKGIQLQNQMHKKVKEIQQQVAENQSNHQANIRMSKANQNQSESKLVQYFENTIKRLEREIHDLRTLLQEKENEVHHYKDKCVRLQNKLGEQLQNSIKLKGIEQKVLNLGIDRSLLKNFQDLFKRPA